MSINLLEHAVTIPPEMLRKVTFRDGTTKVALLIKNDDSKVYGIYMIVYVGNAPHYATYTKSGHYYGYRTKTPRDIIAIEPINTGE